MVIKKSDLDKIILIYRVFTLHYNVLINSVLEFQSLIRDINSKHISKLGFLLIDDDLILIDDEILDLCKKSCIENPFFEGEPSDDPNLYGEWGNISRAEKSTFDIVSKNDGWRNTTIEDILYTNYSKKHKRHFYIKWAFSNPDDYNKYKNEVKSRRLYQLRILKLNKLLC